MSRVRTGIEVLLSDPSRFLRGKKRLGLLCHQASVNHALVHSATLLSSLPGFRLEILFAPEHGITGDAQDMIPIEGGRDPLTGLPVVSLYGDRKESLSPSLEFLESIDALLVDLQDVGSRYYTFAATMAFCMKACANKGLPVIVLDRPNPIGGAMVEGNILKDGFRSFVGAFPLPARHGMTMGELALFFAKEMGVENVGVVKMEGWRREMSWSETGLTWVLPSPNMPSPLTALVYPGICLVEGTNLSEGRGTTLPFEMVGAPFLDAKALASKMNEKGLSGVIFRPTYFVPGTSKWKGKRCHGVQLHVAGRESFSPFKTGLTLIAEARKMAEDAFQWRREPYEFETERLAFDLLCGTDAIRKGMEGGIPVEEMEREWQEELLLFMEKRREFLLY